MYIHSSVQAEALDTSYRGELKNTCPGHVSIIGAWVRTHQRLTKRTLLAQGKHA